MTSRMRLAKIFTKERVSVFTLILILLCFWISWPYWMGLQIETQLIDNNQKLDTAYKQEQKRLQWEGMRGDSFGSFNALMSTLAFFVVLVSLYFQEKQLKMAKEDADGAKAQASEDLRVQERIANAALETAKLNAINARVEGYRVQIEELAAALSGHGPSTDLIKKHGVEQVEALFKTCAMERRNLLLHLDVVLERNGIDKTKPPPGKE